MLLFPLYSLELECEKLAKPVKKIEIQREALRDGWPTGKRTGVGGKNGGNVGGYVYTRRNHLLVVSGLWKLCSLLSFSFF